MENSLSRKDRHRIETGIRDKYAKVAAGAQGNFNYPVGRSGLEALGYDPVLIEKLPEILIDSYCGVGNPFSLGPLNKADAVLDIGCGTGVDTIIAAMITGPSGKSAGVDIVEEMLQKAKAGLKLMDLENVAFYKASGEKLPFENNSFDVIISNGAINLVPDKYKAVKEAARVLKSGGRFMAADQVLSGELPKDLNDRIESWFH